MRDLDKIEKMMRVGKVIKIEPMPKPVAPHPLPAGILKSEMTREDRLRVAARIVELSNQVLSTKENVHYIALKIGSGSNSNAARVRNNRVSFFIRSTDLLNKARAEGFDPEPLKSTTAANKDKFRFWGLGLSDIEAHEALFREIVKESVGTIMDRRPKRK
jgi:hypothetical protein